MIKTPLIVETASIITHSIIWLHGLGADGSDFASIVPELNLPKNLGIRFIFPHAPVRPVTLNGGYLMPAWFDIYSISERSQHDKIGLEQSEKFIHSLIENETNQGIATQNILLAGFSQGGTMALFTGLRYPKSLGGMIGLSTYLPPLEEVPLSPSTTNAQTPIFLCHGEADGIVPLQLGLNTYHNLKKHHFNVTWLTYPMQHTVCTAEIRDIAHWIIKQCST